MNYRHIAILLLAVLATGCTLNTTGLDNIRGDDSTPIIETTAIPTTQPTTTTTSVQQQSVLDDNPDAARSGEGTAVEAATVDQQQFVLPGCTVQHPEWPIYIVKAGDALARIAARVNSTVDVLAQVNCLVDVNRIYVGQQLRVPLTYVPPEPVEPPPNIPLIDQSPLPANVCVVMPNNEQASIWGAGVTDGTAAILVGTVRFVRHADNAYIVELSPGVEGWVSAMEAHLEGTSCPNQNDGGSGTNPNIPDNLPVIRHTGAPPSNLCSVVKEQSPGTRYVYGGASSAHAPIAIMGDYLLYLAQVSGGYEVVLPGWDMTDWIPASGVTPFGNTCPD